MRYLFILMFTASMSLTSCVTSQKVTRYLEDHPEEFAELCADEFPVTEKLIPGKTVVETRTETLPGKVIPCPPDPVTGKQQQVQCPDISHTFTDSNTTDTLIVPDKAKERVLQNRIKALQADSAAQSVKYTVQGAKLSEAKDKARTRFWWLVGIGVAGAVAMVWKLRRFIPGMPG